MNSHASNWFLPGFWNRFSSYCRHTQGAITHSGLPTLTAGRRQQFAVNFTSLS